MTAGGGGALGKKQLRFTKNQEQVTSSATNWARQLAAGLSDHPTQPKRCSVAVQQASGDPSTSKC